MQLSELKIGEKDAAGIVVFDIYTINSKCYAVYRTKARVMVQFADDHNLAESQRQNWPLWRHCEGKSIASLMAGTTVKATS